MPVSDQPSSVPFSGARKRSAEEAELESSSRPAKRRRLDSDRAEDSTHAMAGTALPGSRDNPIDVDALPGSRGNPIDVEALPGTSRNPIVVDQAIAHAADNGRTPPPPYSSNQPNERGRDRSSGASR